MATVVAIAIMREQAMKRLEASMAQLVQNLSIEPVEFPLYDRDATYLQAAQLTALATFFERVVTALAQPEGEPTLDNMTIAQLKALAAEHNVDLTGVTKKADIIAAIEAGTVTLTETEGEPAPPIESGGEFIPGQTYIIGTPGPEIITASGSVEVTSENAPALVEKLLTEGKQD